MIRNAFFLKWTYFWGSLVAILVVIIFVAFYFFSQQDNDLDEELQNGSQSLNSLVNDVELIKKQQQLFQQYSDSFQHLMEEGLSKDQDRVLWADIMLKEKQRLMLNSLSVQLEPQRSLISSIFSSSNLSTEIFFMTNVDIKGSQYVDTDLFSIFYDIYHYITPFYIIKSCEVTSVSTVAPKVIAEFKAKTEPVSPGFNFSCSMVVFNAQPRKYKGPT